MSRGQHCLGSRCGHHPHLGPPPSRRRSCHRTIRNYHSQLGGLPRRRNTRRTPTKLRVNLNTLVCLAVLAAPATAPTSADSSAIRATALDYIEGWYEGNADRMARAVHPELAKRIVRTNERGISRLDNQSAMTLVNGTRAGGGRRTPVERQQKDVTILDIYRNAASVKVVASDWVDYLQVAKYNGAWQIVNRLWELKPVPNP